MLRDERCHDMIMTRLLSTSQHVVMWLLTIRLDKQVLVRVRTILTTVRQSNGETLESYSLCIE